MFLFQSYNARHCILGNAERTQMVIVPDPDKEGYGRGIGLVQQVPEGWRNTSLVLDHDDHGGEWVSIGLGDPDLEEKTFPTKEEAAQYILDNLPNAKRFRYNGL